MTHARLLFLALLPAAALAQEPATSALTLESGLARAPEQEAVVFEHADLAFKVDPSLKRVDGDASLTFRALRPLERLVVDLDRNYAIESVSVDGRALPAGAWRNPEGRMTVDLPAPLAKGASTTLRIVYGGHPRTAVRAPWDGGFVWATAPTGEPWIGSAVQGEGCDLLWPCIDHPMGEPLLVDEAFTVPAPLVAPGNGVFVGMEEHDGWRTYRWRAKSPDTYAIVVNAGPYELLSADYESRYGNTIPLRFWHLRGNEAKAKQLFAEFPLMLEFFEGFIGPYPFADEKMGVVETPYLGMEHQTVNAYGNGYKLDEFGYDWLLQHEFAHEWFGNQVTNVDWDDMWLHEGFGTYMQPLYGQYLHGDMAYFAMLHTERMSLRNKYPVVSGHSQDEHEVYDAEHGPGNDIYYKGSLMLHTLRQLIGDKDFFASIRSLVYGRPDPKPGNFRPRYSSTRDYVAIVDRITGRKLDWFFDVYLRDAALPRLDEQRVGDTLKLRWVTEHGKPFPMPIEVQVGDTVHTVPMSDGSGQLQVPAGSLLVIDPRSKVLREAPYVGEYQQWMKQQRAKQQAAKK
jgi:aminopeptidase N